MYFQAFVDAFQAFLDAFQAFPDVVGVCPTEGGDAAVAVVGSDGKKGSGAYTVNEKCEAVVNSKVLQPYREDGLDGKVWEYTMAEYERILGQT
jgi:hypothetical protein